MQATENTRPRLVVVNAGRLDWVQDAPLDWSRLEGAGFEVQRYADSSPSTAEIASRAAGATVLVTKEVPVDVDALPACVRLIVEAGTGFNNVDVTIAQRRGIAVANVPAYSTEAVAQLVLTFLLAASCSLTQQARCLERGDRSAFSVALHSPHFELAGRVLCLVGGSGAIGQRVAALAGALGMRVLIWGRSSQESLASALAQSDFVSLHCPLTAATRHLIGAAELAALPNGAWLINTARGGLVDEAALIAALREGRLAGAALDVQETEPPADDNPLYSLPNVILTPHIGWKRAETRQRLVDAVARNVSAWAAGAPVNLVTP